MDLRFRLPEVKIEHEMVDLDLILATLNNVEHSNYVFDLIQDLKHRCMDYTSAVLERYSLLPLVKITSQDHEYDNHLLFPTPDHQIDVSIPR